MEYQIYYTLGGDISLSLSKKKVWGECWHTCISRSVHMHFVYTAETYIHRPNFQISGGGVVNTALLMVLIKEHAHAGILNEENCR